MFDSFFQSAKKYTYDAANTLGRAASMLLQRGVRVEVGDSACTNGIDTIWLPQAMRRHLGWDEIDLVRYLLHHENAHILHSEERQRWASPIMSDIENCLEDLRIEAIESKSHIGSLGIFNRGHAVMSKIWDGIVADMPADQCPLPTAVVHAVYACGTDPTRINETTGVLLIDSLVDRFKRGLDESADPRPIHERCVDHDLLNDKDRFRLLVTDIAKILGSELRSIQSEKPGAIDFSNVEHMYEDAEDSSPNGSEAMCDSGSQYINDRSEQFGGGMIERCIEQATCGKSPDGDGNDETISADCLRDRGGNGLALGNFENGVEVGKMTCYESKDNWEWGRWACGMATPLVNLLRGESRSAWSKPKDSGVRIAQARVPGFLQGLTDNILRRRRNAVAIGTSVVMLVDDSGSMDFEAESRPAWRSAALLGHACERAGLRCMISRYANYVHIEKFFHMPMAAVRMRMGPCLGGGTNAMKAFESAEANLAQERSERKVVFFICDGQTYDCRSKIKEMKGSGIEVYPLMIGRDGCRAAHNGGYWDLPETVKIPNPSQNLASTVVDRLCNTIR